MKNENRPNPDDLLKQIENDENNNLKKVKTGQLKIFLGYCAGVGKTYKMLQEANLKKKTGIDVIVGIAETHKRRETGELLKDLEIMPRKKIKYSGITIEEMDIDAVLKRRPELVIVDELAHTNAPGSRHLKRCQDVEELISAGINVFTTLNIQHIESLIDVVYQFSGIKVNETVPDKILENADEIELVDLTPEKLLERLHDGKVYIPERAKVAMKRFFRKDNLLSLRELSLSYTARRVEGQERIHEGDSDIMVHPWLLGSRLLVAISPSVSSERLLRFTHRIADDLNAEWYAVYVESMRQVEMSHKALEQLNKNLRLAEELGAKVFNLSAKGIADQIVDFAREKNVTLIVAGSSERSRFQEILKGSVLNELIKKSGSINVLVMGEKEKSGETKQNYFINNKTSYKSYILSIIIIAVTVAAGWMLRDLVEPISIGMLLLLPVITSGILWGVRAGLFASLIAVAAYDFFFIPPLLTFRISDVKYMPSFIVFILVSVTISYLAKIIRWQAESFRYRERFISALNSFSRSLILEKDLNDILNRAVKNIKDAFESEVVIFLPDKKGNMRINAGTLKGFQLSENEMAIASWVYINGREAGKNTKTLSSSEWSYMPVNIENKTIGVISLKNIGVKQILNSEQNKLLESFINVIAIAIIRSIKTRKSSGLSGKFN